MRENGRLYCNGCGRKIEEEQDLIREGVLRVETKWGYFSHKDGEKHSFCLCEKCYDKMVKMFALPVTVEEYL